MKKILIAAITLFALFSTACTKQDDQIRVRFHNTLDQDITDARMEFDDNNQTAIGLIPAGATTDYVDFDYFQVGDSWPMGSLKGNKEGEVFSAWSGMWCLTGVTLKQLEPGDYQIDIVKFGSGPEAWYQLKFAE